MATATTQQCSFFFFIGGSPEGRAQAGEHHLTSKKRDDLVASILRMAARTDSKRLFGGVALLYLLAAVALFPRYRLILNPDATAYLSIAERYAEGDIAEAVNAYWAPLFSWILTPAVATLIEPLDAAKALQVLSGLAALGSCWLLLERLSVPCWQRIVLCISMIPLLLYYAYSLVTPDLLTAGLLLLLMWLVLAENWDTWRLPIATGILGGLAFLARGAPVLPLVIVTQVAAAFLRAPGEHRGPRVAASLGILAAVALPWIVAMSLDEGAPTLSTAAAFNWSLASPEVRDAYPMNTRGLLPPAHRTAVSVWDDPGQIEVPRWSPFDDPVYAAKRFLRNLTQYLRQAVMSLPLATVLAPLGIVLAPSRPRRLCWFLVGFGGLVLVSYSPLFFEERYAFTAYLLIVLVAGRAVAALRGHNSVSSRSAMLLTVLLTVLLSMSIFTPAVRELAPLNGEGAQAEQDAASLLAASGHGDVAANSQWASSLAISYRADARFFGIPAPDQSPASVRHDLDSYGIDIFLLWGETQEPPYLAGFTPGEALWVHGSRLTVYQR